MRKCLDLTATVWSACRIGAPQEGVRQIWASGGEEQPGGHLEVPPAGVGASQVAGGRVGVHPAHPHLGLLIRANQVPGDRGGQWAVPDELRGFGVGAGQGAVGHHQVQLDRGAVGSPSFG